MNKIWLSQQRCRLTCILIFFPGLVCGATAFAQSPPSLTKAEAVTVMFTPSTGKWPWPYQVGTSLSSPLPKPYQSRQNFDASVSTWLNTQDGFSTIGPAHVDFSHAIDEDTIDAGVTVHLIEAVMDSATGLPLHGLRLLQPNDDFNTRLSGLPLDHGRLLIYPLKPLRPSSGMIMEESKGYIVVLTRGIRSQDGVLFSPSDEYRFLSGFLSLFSIARSFTPEQSVVLRESRQRLHAEQAIAADFGFEPRNTLLTYSFVTNSGASVLEKIAENTLASDYSLQPLLDPSGKHFDTADLDPTSPGLAEIYFGHLTIPYYSPLPHPNHPHAPALDHWHTKDQMEVTRHQPYPQVQAWLEIPLLATVPKTMPGKSAPWPVLVFMHGNTGNRTKILQLADLLADIGFATLAIDLPLHGLLPGNQSPLFDPFRERHFFLDEFDNTHHVSRIGGDGMIDLPGSMFLNFQSPLTSRDNIRQSISDFIHLIRTIPGMDIDNDGELDFDPRSIYFLGNSFGAVAGVSVMALLDDELRASVLGMPGGGFAKMIDGGPTITMQLQMELEQMGLQRGGENYEHYLDVMQIIYDGIDPVNVASRITQPVLIFEIVGDPELEAWPDLLIPNHVLNLQPYDILAPVIETAPLAGTDPLAQLMNLKPIIEDTRLKVGLHGIIRSRRGAHVSLMESLPDPEVTQMFRKQMISFFASQGTSVEIFRPDLVAGAQP